MPIAKFKCIREVTSEDDLFPAKNLLQENPGKKWKTKSVGEKSAYVIFELENPVQIIGIDIGNEHSAFVEVLVSNGCRPEDFTEILITCSFMTPIESKNSSNPNRVRCFNKDALVANVVSKKWNMLKVLCTQPFNKHVQYGLSFINIHTMEIDGPKNNIATKKLVPENFLIQKENKKKNDDEKKDEGKNKLEKTNIIAKISLREASPNSDSESSETLFSRWKKTRDKEILPSTAASIRQASKVSSLRKSTDYIKTSISIAQRDETQQNQGSEIPDRNRNDLIFGTEDEAENANKRLQRLSKLIQEDQKRLSEKNEEKSKKVYDKQSEKTLKQLENRMLKEKDLPIKEKNIESSCKKRMSSPSGGITKKRKSEHSIMFRPFNQLLGDVVLVISGIQNPDRANLREKALAMGAKYKTDWQPGCTHLICAFKNTPKYNQVKEKGKIVKLDWIVNCFDQKKYLPWRRFALDSDDEAKSESDTEIWDETLKEVVEQEEMSINQIKPNSSRTNHTDLDNMKDEPISVNSGSDTDDEINRIIQKNKENRVPFKERDIYEVTTEEEEYTKEKHDTTQNSLSFFNNIKFCIANDITQGRKNQLERCINHYGGFIIEKTNEADIIITETLSDICISGKFKGEVVRPQWIFECNDMEQKIAMSPYKIAKN